MFTNRIIFVNESCIFSSLLLKCKPLLTARKKQPQLKSYSQRLSNSILNKSINRYAFMLGSHCHATMNLRCQSDIENTSKWFSWLDALFFA